MLSFDKKATRLILYNTGNTIFGDKSYFGLKFEVSGEEMHNWNG